MKFGSRRNQHQRRPQTQNSRWIGLEQAASRRLRPRRRGRGGGDDQCPPDADGLRHPVQELGFLGRPVAAAIDIRSNEVDRLDVCTSLTWINSTRWYGVDNPDHALKVATRVRIPLRCRVAYSP